MRKIIFILSSIVLTFSSFAQSLQNYVQFRSGVTSNKTFGSGYSIQGEYGKTYKWLDIGLSMEYFSTLPIGGLESGRISVLSNNSSYSGSQGSEELTAKYTTSLSIHPMFNLIKLFDNKTNHAFKIGTSIGVEHRTRVSKFFSNGDAMLGYESQYVFNHFPLDVQYEYILKNNLGIGAYVKSTCYSSVYLIGLSVRHTL